MDTNRRTYSKEERLERACLRAAMNIRGLWEEKGSSDTRLLEALLIPDELTIVGRSHAHRQSGRREHVVPRLVIVEECHSMLEARASDAEIARFIQDHLKIVHISREEADLLDRKDSLDLRQTMPKGWKIGDDVFARLTTAGIEWSPYPAFQPSNPADGA